MTRHKALFRYRDGRVESGWFVGDLPLDRAASAITFAPDESGESHEVPLAELKAIFLLRPWTGGALLPPDATRVTVEFFDGEQISGQASGWGPGRSSFILIPEEQSKVDAIMVASASLASVEVESP